MRPGSDSGARQGGELTLTQTSSAATAPDLRTLLDPHRLALIEGRGLRVDVPEDGLERVCRMARKTLGVQAAWVSVVGAAQTIVVADGLEVPSELVTTALEDSLCARVVAIGKPLIVADAASHPWAADTALVLSGHVVAYLGVPLVSRDGVLLGALCASSAAPHSWTAAELEELTELASWAEAELERYLTELELCDAMEAASSHRERLRFAVTPRRSHRLVEQGPSRLTAAGLAARGGGHRGGLQARRPRAGQ